MTVPIKMIFVRACILIFEAFDSSFTGRIRNGDKPIWGTRIPPAGNRSANLQLKQSTMPPPLPHALKSVTVEMTIEEGYMGRYITFIHGVPDAGNASQLLKPKTRTSVL